MSIVEYMLRLDQPGRNDRYEVINEEREFLLNNGLHLAYGYENPSCTNGIECIVSSEFLKDNRFSGVTRDQLGHIHLFPFSPNCFKVKQADAYWQLLSGQKVEIYINPNSCLTEVQSEIAHAYLITRARYIPHADIKFI